MCLLLFGFGSVPFRFVKSRQKYVKLSPESLFCFQNDFVEMLTFVNGGFVKGLVMWQVILVTGRMILLVQEQ